MIADGIPMLVKDGPVRIMAGKRVQLILNPGLGVYQVRHRRGGLDGLKSTLPKGVTTCEGHSMEDEPKADMERLGPKATPF